jgi:cob(I)alamin adenosyltransferase
MTRTESDSDQLTDQVINGVSNNVAALRSARGAHRAAEHNRVQAERLAQMKARHEHRISELGNPVVREGVRRLIANIQEENQS